MSEYALPLSVVVLGIGFFICVTNSIYAGINTKNRSTWKKQSVFTTYKAWLTYAFCIAVLTTVLFIIAGSNVINGFSNLGKEQDSITQQQQQPATADAGTDTAQSQTQK